MDFGLSFVSRIRCVGWCDSQRSWWYKPFCVRGVGSLMTADSDLIAKYASQAHDAEFRPGAETLKVFRIGEWVYKIRHANLDYANFEWHNDFFGDMTPYKVLAEGVYKGYEVLLLRQPYVKIVPDSNAEARRQLGRFLCSRFGTVLEADAEMWGDGWHFDNLGGANVGVDSRTGEFVVVDCLIRRRGESEVVGIWKGCDFEIKTLKRKT